ncbi:MAG: ribonuclease P protein component [Oscillospiraceae bacterium]|nr:ribonuclease P protein component [Oscillospiraceae bacterium]
MASITSLKKNFEFKRLYTRGESAVSPFLAVYAKKNRYGFNRLGITVGTKVGKAVTRNLVRRRIREAYRLNQDRLCQGCDIVIVARVRAASASYRQIEASMLKLLGKLDLLRDVE